jgi:hypothetical protein
MATIIANTSFAYANSSFQHMKPYDTTIDWVAAANTAHPERFFASGGTKTATDAFVMLDARAGGFERIVHVGDVLPSGDPAVTAAPKCFA